MSSRSTSKTQDKKYIKNSYLLIYKVLEKIYNSFLNIVDDKEPFIVQSFLKPFFKFCNGVVVSHIIYYAIRGTF